MTTRECIQLDHFYAHPPSAVWKALTDPALHARWWAAGEVRAEVGHRFELDMGRWGRQLCEVLVVEPERLLRYRFAAVVLDTIITWQLIPEGAGTRLILTHEGFNLDTPLGRQAYERMKSGWPTMLARLEMTLVGPLLASQPSAKRPGDSQPLEVDSMSSVEYLVEGQLPTLVTCHMAGRNHRVTRAVSIHQKRRRTPLLY